MDGVTVVADWVGRLEAGWRARDPAAIGALFTPDARYHRGPFDEPHRGPAAIEAHWARTLARQTDPLIWIGPAAPLGDDPTMAAVFEFWCVLHDPATGAPRTAAGCVRLWLAPDGRCVEFREYWQAVYDAASEPVAGWWR